MPSRIQFTPDNQIPTIKESMPLLELRAPAVASTDLLERMRDTVAPKARFKELKRGARAAYDGKRLVAFVNPKTGESKVFPSLEALKPGKGLAEHAGVVADRLARDRSLFPEDATRAVPLSPITLMGANHLRGQERSAAEEYLGYVRIQRRVEGAPVWGHGTRAMVAVAGDDSIHGFSHRWREAHQTGERLDPYPRDHIAKAILFQLSTVPANSEVRVDRVTSGYYDGGGRYLQPVYRFEATVISPQIDNAKHRPANRHVFGYVPIGDSPEPLPVVGLKNGRSPSEPPKEGRKTPLKKPPPGDPTVGRYVVRNDSSDWVTSANEFFTSLQAAKVFGGAIPFTDKQYYWAEPRLFTNEKNSFINSVQVALNEVHGNWWLFSTKDNSNDLVSLASIPSSGYGGGGGGSLAYWIIHSCEVIPTQTDEPTSFDVWWDIFNGLHAVVGYRTEMWIGDHVVGPFGFVISLGAPVVPAWLNDIASDDSYDDGATYYDSNRMIKEPMGRAAAVAVCGHSDDIVSQVDSLGRADCLTEWWFNN
jgi:Family of unknown function (DUF6345)